MTFGRKDKGPGSLTLMLMLALNLARLTHGGKCRRCAEIRRPESTTACFRNLSVPQHGCQSMPSPQR